MQRFSSVSAVDTGTPGGGCPDWMPKLPVFCPLPWRLRAQEGWGFSFEAMVTRNGVKMSEFSNQLFYITLR